MEITTTVISYTINIWIFKKIFMQISDLGIYNIQNIANNINVLYKQIAVQTQ